jgi:thiol-disulfide isomerase/thioredoxin
MSVFSFDRRLVVAGLLVLTLALAPGSTGIPGFDGNAGWLNGPALTPADLRGKVVLVDFWEYTCINCLRTLPYLRTWYERYHDHGLVIVGVHTPEFTFSGDAGNVKTAIRQLDVTWPVVLDDKNAIWDRYKNDGWPHEYLFDQTGRLVDSVTGEGQYPETESKIQGLLKAENPQLSLPPVMALLPQDSYDKPGALCYPRTPEVLLEKVPIANAAASGDSQRTATYSTFYTDVGGPHKDGAVYLQGMWHLSPEAAVLEGPRGYVALQYHAIQVVGVLTEDAGKSVRVDVTQDGAPVAKDDAGKDIHFDADGKSYITVDASREYDLVMNAKFAAHDLRLIPQGRGVAVYSFAFESCEVPK